MNRLSILLFLLGALASLAAAASAPTFCKCTCFTNSTIIEIKSKSSTAKSPSSHLKLPSDDDDVVDTNHQDEPTLDPRSLLLDFGNDADNDDDDDEDPTGGLLFPPPPSARRRVQPAAEQHSRPNNQRRGGGGGGSGGTRRGAQGSASCNQCNKAFCLSQSLPICKDAADKDVVTMCFQRDSRKDQIIVWGFILGTAGLLGWAGAQKAMAMREQGALAWLPGFGAGAGAGGAGSRGSGSGLGLGGRIGIPRGIREGIRVGAARVGATGSDAGRGAYAAVGGHSRDSSIQTGISS